jgi:hypothetical protein
MQQPGQFNNVPALRYMYIDRGGQVVIDGSKYQSVRSFSEGLAAVHSANQGWGFIDKTGSMIIQPQFADVRDFSEGMASVQIGGSWGVIDKTGRVIIAPQYDGVNSFSEGVAVAYQRNEVYFIDPAGRRLRSFGTDKVQLSIYDNARFSEGLIDAYDPAKAKSGYLDKGGNFVITPMYEEAAPFSQGLARVLVIEDAEERLAFIDHNGRFVIPPSFNTDGDFARNSTDFSEGRASLTEGLSPTVTKSEKFIYIDKRGQTVLSTNFSYAGPLRGGIALVYEARANKWGFIDSTGTLVIPLQYDLAYDFSDGLACVAVADNKSLNRLPR